MSSIKLKGSTSGDVTITVPAQAGTNTVTIPAASGNLPLSNLDHVTNRPNAKPLILNGDMAVAQRSTSLTGQTGSAFQMDRFGFQMDTFGTWTMTQAADGPTGSGFTHALKWDCTTADTSLDAGHFGLCHYRIEGQDLQLLKKGTASAEKITLAFWVKSAKTGTYIVDLSDTDNTRQISQAYTISSADTWEKKVLSFPADTTGAFDNDNAVSLAIHWWLGAGSNYSGGTLNTSWASNTNANRAVGNVNLADSTSNDWYITGVQLEVGEFDATTIPPFQHESFGDNLSRCQRYYQKSYSYEDAPGTVSSGNRGNAFVYLMGGSTDPHIPFYFYPELRVTPTVVAYSTANANTTGKMTAGATDATANTNAVVNCSKNHIVYASSVTAADDVYVAWTADGEL